MIAHRNIRDEEVGEPGTDTRAGKRPAEYSSPGMWLVGSLATIGVIATVYGYGQYKATTAVKTAASQVETTGAASTPSPPPSTTGQGDMR